jgi:hypothetical protein
VGGMVTIALFNLSGITVTKHLSSLTRSILDATRTLIIWGVALCLPKPSHKASVPGEKWEEFHVLQLVGFIILIIGNFIYNEILVLPFWGFNKNTKRNLKK